MLRLPEYRPVGIVKQHQPVGVVLLGKEVVANGQAQTRSISP